MLCAFDLVVNVEISNYIHNFYENSHLLGVREVLIIKKIFLFMIQYNLSNSYFRLDIYKGYLKTREVGNYHD